MSLQRWAIVPFTKMVTLNSNLYTFMKNNKPTKSLQSRSEESADFKKPKKKLASEKTKLNIKSKKFWKEILDTEGEEIERFIR